MKFASVVLPVEDCPECGQDHDGIRFEVAGETRHVGECPLTGERFTMRVSPENWALFVRWANNSEV